jgi:hypothetical protein
MKVLPRRGARVQPTTTASATALIPAAARQTAALNQAEEDLSGAAIEMFTKAVGGRDALSNVLAIADTAPDVAKVADLLLDPRYDRLSLRRICEMAGLTVADLFVAYRKALITRAHIEASHIIANKLPPIVADVMTRATPALVVCAVCHGERIEHLAGGATRPCVACAGEGRVFSEPDLDRQKLALELGQLTSGKGSFLIQQNQQIVAASAAGSHTAGALEQLQQAVGDVLFTAGRRRIVPIDPPIITDPPSALVPQHEPTPPDRPPPPSEPGDPPEDDDEAEEDPEDEPSPTPPVSGA